MRSDGHPPGRYPGLYQHSCLFAVLGVVGFVGELALLHQRDADTEEHGGHGYRAADIHINAIQRSVHDPNTPPELYLAEVVRMATVFPKADVTYLTGMGGTKIMALLVSNELDSS